VDRLRARQAALIERLLKADKGDNDAALRREIAMVAAMMVELTASRDGEASPIHNILKGGDDASQAHGCHSAIPLVVATLRLSSPGACSIRSVLSAFSSSSGSPHLPFPTAGPAGGRAETGSALPLHAVRARRHQSRG
jgi:hypothetical protein